MNESTRRMLRHGLGPSVVVMASALALSACSSSPASDANGKIDSSFIAKVDRTCSAILATWNPFGPFPYPTFNPVTPDPTVLPKVGTYFAQYLPSRRQIPAETKALGEPATGANRWTRLRSLALQDNSVAMAQVTYAQQGDVKGFVATVHTLSNLSDEIILAARPAGFPTTGACARVFG